ncbi:outer membrane receptor protein involved in Fe transport [Sphingopyxis italica]|uniref:Outer membrane receptor protein involved in Fe transport n=1 Tax=Sphingopyxis italica TaxID=1129133 RepID=A0A7X5XRH1_9SPHN|nr:TonB-dependent receptor [Sphingopyxis italica]NJB89696.1 outer membrane receptor protein involved in Fe transport [Sphingopyxis italica]
MTKSHLFLGAAAFAVAISVSQPVLAQDTPPCADTDNNGVCDTDEASTPANDGDAIIVTGSRIARANFDTVEPSVVVSSEDIEARGFETLGQALNEQPSFGVPGSSPVGGQSGFGQGQSFVNFLGLGSQRTLTLVNGRRFVGSNTASIFGPTGAGSQVDLNVIPTKLVERVETIVVGGAPIYGSDAISGTINVVLKQDYEGFELDGQYGLTTRGDAANYRFRALAGYNFGDGRGNVTVSAEYNKGEGLTGVDRPAFASGLFFRDASDPTSGFTQELYADRRLPAISETGSPIVGLADFGLDFNFPDSQGPLFGLPAGFNGAVTNGAGDQLKFDENGNLIPIDFGTYAGRPGSFGIDFAGGNGFSLVPTSNLLSETRRYSGIITTKYELSDSIRFFGEAWYSNSKGRNLRDQPVYNSALFDAAGTPDGNIIVSVDNPFLSTAARAAIIDSINNNPFSDQNFLGVTQDYFYLGRANTDLATGNSTGEVEVMRFVAGLDGSFDALAGTWNWEVVGNYGRSKTSGTSRELVQQNFENAVDAVLDGNGNIVCRPGHTNASIQTVNSTCAPLNLFGTGRVSQEALDYISAIARPVSLNKQKVFSALLSGPLFALPGGDLSIAVGYEHREETQDFDPGAFFRGELQDDGTYASYGRSVPIQPVIGKFNTDELSGELRAELISPSTGAFINLLELQAAGRWVDHSIAGGDFTWTVGGRVKPISDITIRGNFTRSIRAPAITEAFNPSSDFFGFATDPCDQSNLDNGPDPATRAANCAAIGLPANFSSLSDSRSFTQAIAGNPSLNNEKADSWTVGVVLEPSFIPRFRASVDYVDIKLKDVISELSGSQVVANCYDSADFPANEFCDRITRDAFDGDGSADDGQISFIETGYFNSAQLRYKGYLASIDYRVPTDFISTDSQIGVNLSYQYLDELSTRADANSAKSQTDGSIGYSKHKGVLTLNYSEPTFNLFTQLSYIGKAQIDPQAAEDFYPDGLNDIPSVIFVNMGVRFDVDERFELQLNVDNVFDKQPPYPYPASGGTITYFRGLLGRYVRAGATVKF